MPTISRFPNNVGKADLATSWAAWEPTGYIASTFPRTGTMTSASVLTSGTLFLAGGTIVPAGKTVNNVTCVIGGTALVTGSNQWFCLVDQSLNVLAKTADDTATAWVLNTSKTLPLSRVVTDANITSGAATLTSATAAFTSADVGAKVTVIGAGAAAAPLGTSAVAVTISSVTNATTAVVSANAGTTVTNAVCYISGSSYAPTVDTAVYVGVLVVASTVPTLISCGISAASTGLATKLCGTSTASLTNPASLGSTAGAITATANLPYAYLT